MIRKQFIKINRHGKVSLNGKSDCWILISKILKKLTQSLDAWSIYLEEFLSAIRKTFYHVIFYQ